MARSRAIIYRSLRSPRCRRNVHGGGKDNIEREKRGCKRPCASRGSSLRDPGGRVKGKGEKWEKRGEEDEGWKGCDWGDESEREREFSRFAVYTRGEN